MEELKRILSFIILFVANGFIFKLLWDWFIVTQFGLPPIGVAGAIGISLIFGQIQFVDKTNEEPFWDLILRWTGKLIAAFIIGYIVHLFL